MTNNTAAYWEANGLSLNTYGWQVTSFDGQRFSGPAKNGEDVRVPFRTGRVRQRKTRDSRVLPLTMVVAPLGADGVRASGLTHEQQLTANYQRIIEAVDVEGQFPLVKRWWENDVVVAATALAEYVDARGPSSDDFTSFDLTIDLMLADPYFYGPQVSVPVGSFTVAGDTPTQHVTLTMGPGRVDFPDGNWIEYTGTGTVVIDGLNGTAKKGSQYVNGQVNRNKLFPEWMVLSPGPVALTGAGTIAYEPAYR